MKVEVLSHEVSLESFSHVCEDFGELLRKLQSELGSRPDATELVLGMQNLMELTGRAYGLKPRISSVLTCCSFGPWSNSDMANQHVDEPHSSSIPFTNNRPLDLHGKIWLAHTQTPSFSLHHNSQFSITTPPYNTGSTAPYIKYVFQTSSLIHFYYLPIINLPSTNSRTSQILAFELLRRLNNPLVHQALQ
ncbi:hypothetical protein IFM89_006949 [Coptis chinensis]|uniref:Uncharacterized protein n=1 Tax=Coptis chinensis TaxID=261450 RepID=A0A835HCW7_9MAGN|nr:hypothetical protein IFM89_006949 [Coptis chinensis]